MKQAGITIIILGALLVLTGLIIIFADKIPFAGKMPGDIRVTGKNSSFYFPVTSCIIISLILTILANIIMRFLNK